MARSERIAALLADQDFQAVIASMRERYTRKVMAATTSPEDRANALTHYHALAAIEAEMRSVAQNEDAQ